MNWKNVYLLPNPTPEGVREVVPLEEANEAVEQARVSVGAQPGCPECGGIPCANLDVCKAPAPDLEQQLTDAAFPVGSNSANAQLVVDLGEAIDIVARSRTGSSPERAAHPESRGAAPRDIVEKIRDAVENFCGHDWPDGKPLPDVCPFCDEIVQSVANALRAAPPSSPGAPQTSKFHGPLCDNCNKLIREHYCWTVPNAQGGHETYHPSERRSSPGADTEQK